MTIELKAIVDRKVRSRTSSTYGLFAIFLDECHCFTSVRSRADFHYTFSEMESLLTVDERVSIVLQQLLAHLSPYKKLSCTKNQSTTNEHQYDDETFKPICSWTQTDLQSFLTRIGVDETSRTLFSDKQVDGYLLLACTENELDENFAMNDCAMRQTLIEHVIR
jgi:hypothetical protein